MIYFITRAYVKIALWFFYKEMKVQGLENIPENQPIIFTPNHQNSFLDAMLIACIVPRPIHYLVRASVFKSKVASWFLGQLNMMPIYRFRDGLKEVKKNDSVINTCAQLLGSNKELMIFPEGNHDMRYAIRPLQKGAARIAFQAIDEYQTDVQIIPVGIYYENHVASRSRVLVTFGKSISAKKHYRSYQDHPQTGFQNLMNEISLAMQQLTLHIDLNKNYEQTYERWRSSRILKPNIIDQYISDTKMIKQLIKDEHSLQSIKQHKNSELSKPSWPIYPLVIYGMINHIIPYWILRRFISQKVKDIHFYSSMKLALGMVLVPLFYVLQSILLIALGVPYYWIVLYILTLPSFGMIALRHFGNNIP